MKAYLLFPDMDFDMNGRLPPNEPALTQDLGLDILFAAMARGDDFLAEVARRVVLSSLDDAQVIGYRQRILTDCLQHSEIVQQIYDLAVEAIAGEKKIWRTGRQPDSILHGSVQALELFVGILKRLRQVCDEHASDFQSDGFVTFFSMLTRELDADYFHLIDEHLKQLRFRGGVLLSAELGTGSKGVRYVLRTPNRPEGGVLKRLAASKRSAFTIRIPERDDAGYRALADLRGRAINLAANALAQSADHILSFFVMLRRELGFYLGCTNLHEQLLAKDELTCMPVVATDGPSMSCEGLYDVALSLRVNARPVGNTVDANRTSLVMITGANQGGKSTFLRSAGLAQFMMQCGMFAAAESYSASLYRRIFTHYKREEDTAMESGKLDEELHRMSEIVDDLEPRCLVLFNESFAATNEREGSEISRQIIRALTEKGITVFFVTHLFDLADSLYTRTMGDALFLRAERRDDGQRTFRIVEGEPLPTSYGPDLYERIFGPIPA